MAVKQSQPKKRKRRYIPTGNPRGRPPKPRSLPPPSLTVAPARAPEPVLPVLAYRTEAAARACGVSVSYMKRLVADGVIRSVLRGRMRLIPIEALREWVSGA
jgi:excisionase family DNA binding protein